MIDARAAILARIRDALGRGDAEPSQLQALRERTARHSRHIEPAFDEPLQQRFGNKLEAAAATLAEAESLPAAAAEVARYLEQMGLEQRIVAGGDELIKAIKWPPSIDVQYRLPQGADSVGISAALCGIAETGTLMLVSSREQATRLNFLPDHHIVVLPSDRILARMEDAWDKLRHELGAMPRTVNFISGPSKTADVEQTVEYGAHGPRCLHVIIVETGA